MAAGVSMQDRTERIQAEMASQGLGLLVLRPGANLFYQSGYPMPPDERPFFYLIPQSGKPALFLNALYREQITLMRENGALEEGRIFCWSDGDKLEDALCAFLSKALSGTDSADKASPPGKIAIDDKTTLREYLLLKEAFNGLPVAGLSLNDRPLVLASTLYKPLRAIKSAEELALMREAGKRSDLALEALLRTRWVGKTEREAAQALIAELGRQGIKGEVIAAAGKNAAEPHHLSDQTLIQEGEALLLDFWGAYQGYYTDCTRTVFYGEPSEEFRQAYETVLKAHLAAEDAAGEAPSRGLRACDLDEAARKVIREAGYGDYFTHRLGHGCGIEEHEEPCLAPGDKTVLQAGMVFSDEPGIYLPGKFGIRIENLLAITEGKAEIFQHYPRTLQCF